MVQGSPAESRLESVALPNGTNKPWTLGPRLPASARRRCRPDLPRNRHGSCPEVNALVGQRGSSCDYHTVAPISGL